MSKILCIDIGAGTMDILYYDTESAQHYKAVVKSPVASIAETIDMIPGNVIVTGCEMGGGAVSKALKHKVRTAEVIMSESAAVTVHHNLERVRSSGITVVEDAAAHMKASDEHFTHIVFGDLEPARIEQIVYSFSVPFRFDIIAVCAQDHGRAPDGTSHLDYRHNLFKNLLDQNPYPHALLYSQDEVPVSLNRLGSIVQSAAQLPTEEVYVMDSGIAAILGAALDTRNRNAQKSLVMDVATSHTVGAALCGDELCGFFEYHTCEITRGKIENLLAALANGTIDHRKVLEEGGHGAYLRRSFGFENADILISTGPKRRLLAGSALPIIAGSPLGDNMMTGCAGLLESVRRRNNIPALDYS